MAKQTDIDEVPFDEFWEHWPRKVSRKTAEKAWEKLKPGEQKLAILDVQKRNRFKAWPSTRKLIPHASTYLNQERWTDEWMDDLKSGDPDGPVNSGPYMPKPKPEPEREYSNTEIIINRAFRDYCYCSINRGGLPEVDTALKARDWIVAEVAPALREDIASGYDPKKAAFELVDMFYDRMDKDYGIALKEITWAFRRKRQSQAA